MHTSNEASSIFVVYQEYGNMFIVQCTHAHRAGHAAVTVAAKAAVEIELGGPCAPKAYFIKHIYFLAWRARARA